MPSFFRRSQGVEVPFLDVPHTHAHGHTLSICRKFCLAQSDPPFSLSDPPRLPQYILLFLFFPRWRRKPPVFLWRITQGSPLDGLFPKTT